MYFLYLSEVLQHIHLYLCSHYASRMLQLICFRTFVFSTWVWSVSLRGFLLYCRVLHYFARSLAGKNILFYDFAPSCYGNVFIYLFCCQRLTKFETTDTGVSICLHWFVPIFHSWVSVSPVFGLGLIFCYPPPDTRGSMIMFAAKFLACLQANEHYRKPFRFDC